MFYNFDEESWQKTLVYAEVVTVSFWEETCDGWNCNFDSRSDDLPVTISVVNRLLKVTFSHMLFLQG